MICGVAFDDGNDVDMRFDAAGARNLFTLTVAGAAGGGVDVLGTETPPCEVKI